MYWQLTKREIRKIQPNKTIQKLVLSGKTYCRIVGKEYLYKKHNTIIRCEFCNKILTPQNITIDHYIPLSKGGCRNDRNNLKIACYDCNSLKSNINPEVSMCYLNKILKERKHGISIKDVILYNNECLFDIFYQMNRIARRYILIKFLFTFEFEKFNTLQKADLLRRDFKPYFPKMFLIIYFLVYIYQIVQFYNKTIKK